MRCGIGSVALLRQGLAGSTIAINTLARRGHHLVSLILDDLLEDHHQRGRSHAQHDYAIDGFERAGSFRFLLITKSPYPSEAKLTAEW